MNGYIRKITSFILTVLFCIAVIIGVGVILSVRNVNVEYIYYSERADEEFGEALENLNDLKGESLYLLGDDDVLACIGDGQQITVESYEKVFPCTLNVVLKERVEQYAVAVASSGGYDIYDSEGVYMCTRPENINPADDSPDVLLNVESDIFSVAVEICGYFKSYFGSVRNLIESVEAESDPITGTDIMTLNLYSGIKIIIVDYMESSEQKIAAAQGVYGGLSDGEKLRGSIYVVGNGGAQSGAYAVYQPSF